MKKKIPELSKEYDIYMKECLSQRAIVYLGSSPSILANCPLSYQKLVDEIELALMNKKIDDVMQHNKVYFETKALDLLDKRKDDSISLASANLLFKSLNMKMENFLNSPQPGKQSVKSIHKGSVP